MKNNMIIADTVSAAYTNEDANTTFSGDAVWTMDQHNMIVERLIKHGCEYLKGREEYTLLKEVVVSEDFTQISKSGKIQVPENPDKTMAEANGVILPLCQTELSNDTVSGSYPKPFLTPLDIRKSGSITDVIPSFRSIQSDKMSINIGFDTELQYEHRKLKIDNSKITSPLKAKPSKIEEALKTVSRSSRYDEHRVLSLQMTIDIGGNLIRYFFLIDPRYQVVTKDGGKVSFKTCIADILSDLRKCYLPDLPLVLKSKIVYKDKPWKGHDPFKVIDNKAMRDSFIPITLICHTGKADISVFRRSKYDVDILRSLGEIQGGWMTVKDLFFPVTNDKDRNYYWLVNLSVRDTRGLTPADNKSLAALGNIINRPKIELPDNVIKHMSNFAISNPVEYYEYAMNDADIVVSFCSELFQRNHAVPITLSSAAASAMCDSIKEYLGISKKADFDRIFRGLELLDEGIYKGIGKDEVMKFLKSTRYVAIRDNPDARLVSEYFEEAYVGGFNTSFFIGWITDYTTDFDLQNAYPTAMANIVDIDWSKNVRDFPRNYELSLQDLPNPIIPAVAVGDFDFPDDCYCPNIPVPVKGGMNIYPRHGRQIYMTGPDMYLALKLGARIKIFRGFTCHVLERDDGKLSQSLAYAVTHLVQDRMMAKKVYKDNPLVEKSLKTMVNSCYGKTAQNVSPKTRYNAQKMGRVDAEPSKVTSPYHAAYTTALVRCMLIGCINQLHDIRKNLKMFLKENIIYPLLMV